jgi:hypothetical protein
MDVIDVDDDNYDADDPTTWVTTKSKNGFAPFPGFYVGGDYTIEDVATVGAAFAGQYVGEKTGDDGKFPLMFDIHGKLLMLNPITIGLNVAFYMAPSNSDMFVVGKKIGAEFAPKSKVLEAMVDFGADLGICNVGITGAMLMDFTKADDDGTEGMAFKIGASAAFPVGETGFAIIPGVIYTNLLKAGGEDAKMSWLDIGVTLQYSF